MQSTSYRRPAVDVPASAQGGLACVNTTHRSWALTYQASFLVSDCWTESGTCTDPTLQTSSFVLVRSRMARNPDGSVAGCLHSIVVLSLTYHLDAYSTRHTPTPSSSTKPACNLIAIHAHAVVLQSRSHGDVFAQFGNRGQGPSCRTCASHTQLDHRPEHSPPYTAGPWPHMSLSYTALVPCRQPPPLPKPRLGIIAQTAGRCSHYLCPVSKHSSALRLPSLTSTRRFVVACHYCSPLPKRTADRYHR